MSGKMITAYSGNVVKDKLNIRGGIQN